MDLTLKISVTRVLLILKKPVLLLSLCKNTGNNPAKAFTMRGLHQSNTGLWWHLCPLYIPRCFSLFGHYFKIQPSIQKCPFTWLPVSWLFAENRRTSRTNHPCSAPSTTISWAGIQSVDRNCKIAFQTPQYPYWYAILYPKAKYPASNWLACQTATVQYETSI